MCHSARNQPHPGASGADPQRRYLVAPEQVRHRMAIVACKVHFGNGLAAVNAFTVSSTQAWGVRLAAESACTLNASVEVAGEAGYVEACRRRRATGCRNYLRIGGSEVGVILPGL
jgi:hypothetical protein